MKQADPFPASVERSRNKTWFFPFSYQSDTSRYAGDVRAGKRLSYERDTSTGMAKPQSTKPAMNICFWGKSRRAGEGRTRRFFIS
ncbi:hypothetical protein [Dickeya sp. CFBP 2040]|uniref:hypothetical protein n=1 Tax=Dickeya sp. CFBP 2040 TaxID=2718531 RepID=UPI001445EAF9|nr:hypothetical protein [Dickeya sp. CFBP 2040]